MQPSDTQKCETSSTPSVEDVSDFTVSSPPPKGGGEGDGNDTGLTIQDLPLEMLRHIWSFVPCNGPTWKTLPLVCKEWYRAIRGPQEPLCPSRQCTPERSVLHTLIRGDSDMLRHVWEDESIDLEALMRGQWFTEMLLGIPEITLVQRILSDRRIPPNFNVDTLMRRACRLGRKDVVQYLLETRRTTADIHDFNEACWCLQERNDDGPFALLLCQDNIAQLLKDPILVDCLTRNRHHRVIRWLVHWESAFCTPRALLRLFMYCMSVHGDAQEHTPEQLQECHQVVQDVVQHVQFPWAQCKVGYVQEVASYGWDQVLRHMLAHLHELEGMPYPSGNAHLYLLTLDAAIVHGWAQCIAPIHESGGSFTSTGTYHQEFRRMCECCPRDKVTDVGRALLKTGRVNLCAQDRMPRTNLWMCMASKRHWELLEYLLRQTEWPTAPPLAGAELDLLMCIMANCPPLASDAKEVQQVARILSLLVERDDFGASARTMLRLVIYAKESQHARLTQALLYAHAANDMMHQLICPDSPTSSSDDDNVSVSVGNKRRRRRELADYPWTRKRRLWSSEVPPV